MKLLWRVVAASPQGLPSLRRDATCPDRVLPRQGAAHLPSGDRSLLVAELTVPPAGLEAPAMA